MPITANIRAIFSHFQNLNLLALLQDMRAGRVTRRGWLSGTLLCPVAHGLPHGEQVRELRAMGQAADLGHGCAYAADRLGAEAQAVLYFVRCWDEGVIQPENLLRQLEELWSERLEDALTVQAFLQEIKQPIVASTAPSVPTSTTSNSPSCMTLLA